MKRKPAPKPTRPAYTITEALTAEERETMSFQQWTLTTTDGRKVHILHWYDQEDRDRHSRGAWYAVADGYGLRANLRDRDFTAAITAALDLIGGAK